MPQAVTTTQPEPPRQSNLPPELQHQTALQEAIHEPHQADRDRTIQALAASELDLLRTEARRLAGCASSVHLYIDPAAGKVTEYVHRCKSRLCPFCARFRSAHVADQMQALVDVMTHPRHLVLTVHSRPAPLTEQLADLRNWFAKFRRTPFWRKNVSTGVYTIEVTKNSDTGLWHPHLHILFDGKYLPFKVIQQLWHEITAGSEIVWIEEVYNRQGAVRELCKYIGKPAKSKAWTHADIREYALAIRGTRMVQTFGKRPPKPIVDEDPNTPAEPDRWHVSVSRLVYLAGHDDPLATAALPLIAARWPHLGRYIYSIHPQLEPDQSRADRRLAAMAAIERGWAPPRYPTKPPDDPAALEKQIADALERIHICEDIAGRNLDRLAEDAD